MPDLELLPEDAAEASATWRPDRGIPAEVRKFGFVIDVTKLHPGDLILTREIKPDAISGLIVDTQERLGYGPESKWTHAAMYVGDKARVIEATFTTLFDGAVCLSYLYKYCGKHAVMCRRPKHIPRDPEAWSMVIEAAASLGEAYDFQTAISLFWKGRKGDSVWDAKTKSYATPGIVCSTLYADCYSKATRRCIGDSGTCVPAYLSICDAFADIPLQWARIG